MEHVSKDTSAQKVYLCEAGFKRRAFGAFGGDKADIKSIYFRVCVRWCTYMWVLLSFGKVFDVFGEWLAF